MKYVVAGKHPAYGAAVGATVDLDPDDPLVQLNVKAGVLEPATREQKKEVS